MSQTLVVVCAAYCVFFPIVATCQAILPGNSGSLSSKSAATDIDWGPLLRESSFFLGIQHGFRLLTEPGSRDELRGPFFRDYFDSVRGLHGWRDGDNFMTNYVGHPMQGAVTSNLYVANDSRAKQLEFCKCGTYWRSRLRAMTFSAIYSAQFELGPVSEASLGNLGSPKVPNTMGYVDLVMTPVGGLLWQVTEDALDRYLVRWLEDRTRLRIGKIAVRGVFNPSRSFSNMLRMRVPWHRDTRPGVDELSRMP